MQKILITIESHTNKDGVATTLKAVEDTRNHLAHGDVNLF